jgi:alkane 1-monooxygenase
MKDLKYLSGYLIPVMAILAMLYPSNLAYLPILFAFVFVPVLDWFFPYSKTNLAQAEESELLAKPRFDYMLWLSFPIHWGTVIFMFYMIHTTDYSTVQLIGIILGVGISSGVLGINAAHELGHRKSKFEQFLAQGLLMSSLYTHFFVEHNRGHHKYVATPQDPASARLNENVYHFVVRSVIGSYRSAWHIQRELLQKNKQAFFSFQNNMLIYTICQIALLAAIFSFGGWILLVSFIGTAIVGALLLEVINYIEHYGMQRKEIAQGKYERVMPWHSWNANYPIGRIMLFELTRHADHHYKASRKYQILRHWDESPELPAGYPAMMLLSTIPPLWFAVMNPKAEKVREIPADLTPDIA